MLILVTGASKGIGFETVKHLASFPEHIVIAVSRNTKSLELFASKHQVFNVMPVKADITKKADVIKLKKIISRLKLPLNILINNAGHLVNKPFEKISAKELQEVYATNVFAPFLLIQSLISLFEKKGISHIVNIGSMGGFQGTSKFAGLSAYSSSKSALTGLTECLAEELKPKGIRVNCLALGSVQTEMLKKAFPKFKAEMKAHEMASFISHFALTGHNYFNGKILPVASTTP